MKSTLCTVSIFLIILILGSLQSALGANISPTLEDQFGNSAQTKLVHDSSSLILNQTMPKLAYKMGENISISIELINNGNKSVDIAYQEPWVALEIKDHVGHEVWPNSQMASIPEFQGKKTLNPGEHLIVKPWGFSSNPDIFPTPKLSAPGNYTVLSVALFTFDTQSKNLGSIEPLWSKPVQITVLPEKYVGNETNSTLKVPEFPFATIILIASIASVILFYRIKFQNHI